MSYQIIGKPTPLIDAKQKVLGQAKYTDDLRLTAPLIIKLFRSVHAYAEILAIDVSKAIASEGVRAVVTGEDFAHTFGVLPISRDEPPLAKKCVRYVGEPVVGVAAESETAALEAISKIDITYRVKSACLDVSQAQQETDDPIHPQLKRKNNLHKHVEQSFGDIEKGFKTAQEVCSGRFVFPSVNHAFTEPHATQVEWSPHGVTVYSSTQVPHYLHKAISHVLDLPLHQIRVIKPMLGGGFGGKSDPFNHEIIAVKLALITRRNVKIVLEREEVFFAHHGRHATTIDMRLGIHKKKGICALSGKMEIDGGAYASFGVVTTYYNGVLLQGPYQIPNYEFFCNRWYTNKPMCGAMRGHGGVNPRFAMEVLLDMACEKLALDPCDYRLQHFLNEDSLTANELRVTSVGIRDGLKQAMVRSDWYEKRKNLPSGKGIGVACGFFISGSALPIVWNQMPQSTVRLTLDFDGGVTVYSGAADIGQGSDTMLAQIVAEVLGIPIAMITVIAADTRLTPIDYGSYSSRVTFMAGNAARNAAIRMRRILLVAAGKIKGIEPPSIDYNSESNLGHEGCEPYDNSSEPAPDNRVGNPAYFRQGQNKPNYSSTYLGANPDYADGVIFEQQMINFPQGISVAFHDAVIKALDFHGALQTLGVYISPQLGGKFKGSGAGLSPSYSFTAVIVEVDVVKETGAVKVEKVTLAHDCGFALNPLAVEGQLEGSIHMALGQALCEAVEYKNGAGQNSSFLNYKLISPLEMPVIDLIYPNSGETEGPFGAKEVGEGCLAPIIPAVANAVYDAIGARVNQLPLTPDKILAAWQKKEKETHHASS